MNKIESTFTTEFIRDVGENIDMAVDSARLEYCQAFDEHPNLLLSTMLLDAILLELADDNGILFGMKVKLMPYEKDSGSFESVRERMSLQRTELGTTTCPKCNGEMTTRYFLGVDYAEKYLDTSSPLCSKTEVAVVPCLLCNSTGYVSAGMVRQWDERSEYVRHILNLEADIAQRTR